MAMRAKVRAFGSAGCLWSDGLKDILIHIGYHKTATTWMQKELFDEKSSSFAPLALDGSPRYLGRRLLLDDDGYRVSSLAPSKQRIDDEMRQIQAKVIVGDRVPVISHEGLSGCLMGGGFDSRVLADRVKECFPKARILCVIREQKSMILSTYMQYIKVSGTRRIRDFLSPGSDTYLPRFALEHFRYIPLISYYRELFSPEKVLVLPYEMFQRQPREFIMKLGHFAGANIPFDTLKLQQFHNKSDTYVTRIMFPFLNLFADRTSVNDYSSLRIHGAFMLLRIADRVLNACVPGLRKGLQKRLRRQVDEFVGDRFAESNRELSDLIGIDLAEYGY